MRIERKITTSVFDHHTELIGRSAFLAFLRLLKSELKIENPRAFFSGKRLLDIGCGSGSDVVRFHRLGAEARGIDTNLIVKGPAFLRANASNLPFRDGHFDIIFAKFLLDLLNPMEVYRLIEEAHRVLRPNGFIFSLNLIDIERRLVITSAAKKLGLAVPSSPTREYFIVLQKLTVTSRPSISGHSTNKRY